MFFAANSYAEEGPGLTLYPHVGQTFFDNEVDVENDTNWGLGVGYRFDSPWALELVYSETEAEFDDALNDDFDAELWHLDALHHLDSVNSLTPFLSFGVGRAEYDYGLTDEDESNLNAGLGVK